MNKILNDKRLLECIDYVCKYGYKQRTDNYYVFNQKDGYINISFWDKTGWNYNNITISFHKNHYRPEDKDIHHDFDNKIEFIEFFNKFYRLELRKYKLQKIDLQ